MNSKQEWQRQDTQLDRMLPFIGREKEIEEIHELLRIPECRLLTLFGLGGVGKTRIAHQIATWFEKRHPQASCLVDLQPVKTPDEISSVVAEYLPNFSLAGRRELREHLLAYLSRRELLLVLDNFEHLLEGTALLLQMLDAAPELKILVTSREPLNVRGEWRYPVHGLSFPEDPIDNTTPNALRKYEAIALFCVYAKRTLPSFAPDEHLKEIAAICRLVEGLPLAIELAAAWVETLSCQEIVVHLQQGLSLLGKHMRDVPQRQRSIQVVLAHTWDMLPEERQMVYQRLTVFNNGFTAEAAERVARADPLDLKAFIEKSLISLNPQGRYHMHGLLRHFAIDQARQDAQFPREKLQAKHSAYFCNFLKSKASQMNDGEQLTALEALRSDIENIRLAWDWAVQTSQFALIHAAADTLYLFYQFSGHYQEGVQRFEKAVEILRQPMEKNEMHQRVLAEILVHLGWLYIRRGQLEQAERVLLESASQYHQNTTPPPPTGMATDPTVPLGILAVIHGDFEQARALGEQVLKTARENSDRGNRMFAHYVLGSVAQAIGRWKTAELQTEQSYFLAKESHNRWFMAYCLADLGNINCALQDYVKARNYYMQSAAIKKEFKDPQGIALATSGLAKVALREGDPEQALHLFETSLDLYEDIGDRGGVANTQHGLGCAKLKTEEFEAAQRYLGSALEVALHSRMIPLALAVVASIGELLVAAGERTQGERLLQIAEFRPANLQNTRKETKHFLPLEAGIAKTPDKWSDLEGQLLKLSIELQTGRLGAELPPNQGEHAESRKHGIIDPLTSRELEVLLLLSEGYSNAEIAENLTVAPGTVKSHTHHIYQKLAVRNRVEAVRKAQEYNLLSS